MCQTEEECFASRLGFRLGLTITFAILITAIICNIQVGTFQINVTYKFSKKRRGISDFYTYLAYSFHIYACFSSGQKEIC